MGDQLLNAWSEETLKFYIKEKIEENLNLDFKAAAVKKTAILVPIKIEEAVGVREFRGVLHGAPPVVAASFSMPSCGMARLNSDARARVNSTRSLRMSLIPRSRK